MAPDISKNIKMEMTIKPITNWWITKHPREMSSWWKTKEAVLAKYTEAKDGSYIMRMEGEPYDFPGYPRGTLLFGSLSPLKHHIKNQMHPVSMKKSRSYQPVILPVSIYRPYFKLILVNNRAL